MSGPDGPWWRRTLGLRVARCVLRLASRLRPPAERAEWSEEWEGELWALEQRGAGAFALLRFALHGAGDAVRLTTHGLWAEGRKMTGALQDVRMALRRLRRAPGFTVVTVTVLALGIGANTALFGALRSALLQTPPYPEPERLVMVDLLMGEAGEPPDTSIWSYPKFESVRAELGFLSGAAGYMTRTVTLQGAGAPVRLNVEIVSPSYFPVLDVDPLRGRVLNRTDEPPAAARAVVLAHDTWRGRFGGDESILGRAIELNGERFQIVGVAPEGFTGLTGSAAGWVSMADAPLLLGPRRLERVWAHWFRVVGRIADGVDAEVAVERAERLGAALTEAFPDPRGGALRHEVTLTPLVRARINPTARLAVSAVGAGAALLLLIAVANVAGLYLARMSARRGDVAVRAALGAGRMRLAREVLTESLVLAVAGGLAGLALAVGAQGGVRWAVAYALETSGTRNLQYLDPSAVGVDGSVLAVGLVLTLVTGVVFGVVPARAAGKSELVEDLSSARRGGRVGGTGARAASGQTVRGLLVAGQLALTLVLLSGAGLMLASFARLESLALGFRSEGVLTARYELGAGASADEVRTFQSRLVERLEAAPDVRRAAVATCAPLAGLCDITGVRQIGEGTLPESMGGDWMHTQTVSPGFFETAGIRVERGRTLPSGLTPEDPPVALIDRAAAETYFPGEDPVGRRIGVTSSLTPEGRPAEIVGVVDDVAYQELEEEPFPTVYFSTEQASSGWGQILVRTDGDAAGLSDMVRRTVLSLRADAPVWDVTTLAARKAAATARTRVILGLFGAFGVTALLLSAVGLWGLVSYTVSRRTREMGLRMALGADARRILAGVAGPPVLLATLGAVTGVGAALLLNRYLGVLLFRVDPRNPGVLMGAVAILLGVAAFAALVPARRATRIDPSEALRAE